MYVHCAAVEHQASPLAGWCERIHNKAGELSQFLGEVKKAFDEDGAALQNCAYMYYTCIVYIIGNYEHT